MVAAFAGKEAALAADVAAVAAGFALVVVAGLKRHLECHHGMSKANKIKFIQDYFSEK